MLLPNAGDEWPDGRDVLHTRFLSGPNSEGSATPSETPEPFGPRNRVHSEAERLTHDNHPINDSAKEEKEKFTSHLRCRRLYLHRVGKGSAHRTGRAHNSPRPAGWDGRPCGSQPPKGLANVALGTAWEPGNGVHTGCFVGRVHGPSRATRPPDDGPRASDSAIEPRKPAAKVVWSTEPSHSAYCGVVVSAGKVWSLAGRDAHGPYFLPGGQTAEHPWQASEALLTAARWRT